MLVDIIATYDDQYKTTLKDLRKNIVGRLAEREDPKKILSFLNKCCILSLDDNKHMVFLGVPNEFVLQQVKKFFSKHLSTIIKEYYNEQYGIEYTLYPELQNGTHDLQIDLKDILPLQPVKEIKETITKKVTLDDQTTASLTEYFGILFQKQYTFDTFVVGASNQFAHSVAEAIAKAPGTTYNPFFMYGGVWLGKTHLMQAIGNAIIAAFPDKVVIYLPTSKFIDHIISAIRKNQLPRLLEKLEEVDVLMLDDIQFLAGKDKTQEIFHTIFNDFTSKQKQIVITSDQPPNKLTLLEPRLQSRFALWVVVDIKPPDFETRVAILETKLATKGETMEHDLLERIATLVHSNVRELEGALNIVLTKKQLLHNDISPQDVDEALITLGYTPPTTTPVTLHTTNTETSIPRSQPATLEQIIQSVAAYYGLTAEAITGEARNKEVSFARQLLMYVAKTKFHRSLQKIGDYFGGRNHASVIYALKTFEEHLKKNPDDQNLVAHFSAS